MTTPEYLAKRRATCRRPILDEEVPHLEAFGAELRSLRMRARLKRAELARRAELSQDHLGELERATVRTRRSTIERIAAALAGAIGDDVTQEGITEQLVQAIGIALAPESQYVDRVNRRRQVRTAEAEAKRAKAEKKKADERLIRQLQAKRQREAKAFAREMVKATGDAGR